MHKYKKREKMTFLEAAYIANIFMIKNIRISNLVKISLLFV